MGSALVVVGALVAAGTVSGPAHGAAGAPAASSTWPVYHGNLLGSGVDRSGASFRPLRPAWTSPVLDGQLYGEPLAVPGKVLVATENDTVYALNATDGKVVWSVHVGTPVPARDLPCGDIGPTVGITSTPVIDTARSEVFVVADELSGTTISHHLVGLTLAKGARVLDQAIDPAGSEPAAQLQRAALTLSAGRVVAGFGGNAGDCPTYHGWVVAVPETGGTARTFEVDPTPPNQQGGIWMGGAAPAVDSRGDVWVATGNGSHTSGSPDFSDSVVDLSSSLRPRQFFAPSTWPADNAGDADLGSTAPALVLPGRVFQSGKSQTAYLLDRAKLGGVGKQVATQTSFCGANTDGGDAFAAGVVYVPCQNGITAVKVTATPPKLTVQWRAPSGSSGPPIVAGGLVWTISHGGVLYGLDPATGIAIENVSIGAGANHFPTPAVGDRLLLAPSTDQVHAFS